MRDIIFRGKRMDNGEWIDGNYYESDISGCFILQNVQKITVNDRTGAFSMRDEPVPFEVDPETVGQYTGLKDRNDKKIFENDVVKKDFGKDIIGVQRVHYGLIYYSKKFAGFMLKLTNDGRLTEISDCEVVGNIHDNPELLEATP